MKTISSQRFLRYFSPHIPRRHMCSGAGPFKYVLNPIYVQKKTGKSSIGNWKRNAKRAKGNNLAQEVLKTVSFVRQKSSFLIVDRSGKIEFYFITVGQEGVVIRCVRSRRAYSGLFFYGWNTYLNAVKTLKGR